MRRTGVYPVRYGINILNVKYNKMKKVTEYIFEKLRKLDNKSNVRLG